MEFVEKLTQIIKEKENKRNKATALYAQRGMFWAFKL